jgi:hypothetical protein
VRYVVEQNVEVEASDAVQARKLARDADNRLSENESVRVSEVTVPQESKRATARCAARPPRSRHRHGANTPGSAT